MANLLDAGLSAARSAPAKLTKYLEQSKNTGVGVGPVLAVTAALTRRSACPLRSEVRAWKACGHPGHNLKDSGRVGASAAAIRPLYAETTVSVPDKEDQSRNKNVIQ